ncbi:MAG: hypothetical protein ACREBW_01730 [Candidatus Micrarchaeaceae archaeon]
MKHSAEYDRFTALVDRVLTVPHNVIKDRIEEYRKQAAQNPNRPGPKPKRKKTVKPSASDHGANQER